VIKCQKKVKNHIAKTSTKQCRFGKNIKMEKLKENGALDVELEIF
jgi:hypothetical protein